MEELKKLLYMMFIITIIASCTSPVEEGNDDDDDNGGGNGTSGYDFSGIEKRELVDVTSGTYTQEDTFSNSFEHTISSFSMGKYEVTYELWYTVRQWATSNGYSFDNAGKEGNDDTAGAAPTSAKYEPVTNVSWRDVIVWCNAYSEMSNLTPVYTYSDSVIKDSQDGNATACDGADADWSANGYRLPTEGEWQYAASYIDRSDWVPYNHVSGDTTAPNDSSSVFGDYAWYRDNSDTGDGRKTHDVGGKTANALGLYDMSGNVWEWCWDWYDDYPTSAETDYRGASTGSDRVFRGGGWLNSGYYLRVGDRYHTDPYNAYFNIGIGFRVAKSLPSDITNYTVTFDSQGADTPANPASKTVTSPATTVDALPTPLKSGYTFGGWFTGVNGGGSEFTTGTTVTGDMTVYAKWVELLYTELVDVTSGTYTQEDADGNSFSHTISGFSMGKYEVTYELWYTVRQWATSNGYSFDNAGKEGNDGTAGAAPTSAKYEPVTTVSWRDVIVWCNAYSEMSGLTPVYTYSGNVIKDSRDRNGTACDGADADWSANGYRLPTEGEWQYAASYIDRSDWVPYNHVSGDTTAPYDSSSVFGDYAWYRDNSDTGDGRKTHDVGGKTANALGLYDMSGNVWEWCWDWYDDYPTSAETDYRGASTGFSRVFRGGSWGDYDYYLRVGGREDNPLYYTSNFLGFRVARSNP